MEKRGIVKLSFKRNGLPTGDGFGLDRRKGNVGKGRGEKGGKDGVQL